MEDFKNILPLNISEEIENGEIYLNDDIGKMAIVIDISRELRPSSTGNTTLISTSGKAKKIQALGFDDFFLSFNVYKYPNPR